MTNNAKKISLTRGEEEVMQALWELGEGYIADIISRMPDPKPKYNLMDKMLGEYFGGSLAQMVSFFSRKEAISTSEMDEIIETMQRIKK